MKSILVHTCCAPCGSAVFEFLESTFRVAAYYYNPNISPVNEYKRRRDELINYCEKVSVPLLEGSYDLKKWVGAVKDYRFLGERSVRCHACYRFRLEETFKKAVSDGFDAVTTVLTISPHKDAAVINKIGVELEKKYGIEFVVSDFKKNNGFKRSLELSKTHGFYRQNYCGCIYSLMERRKDSAWIEKARQSCNQ
ncbi:MAG TPA: epoxyqueuosine reductase QueH [Spirochaetota bacterium]|nr:epoxyqueuosine reductase QueH [Spirochaetota bacterium]HPI88164.1 epoxyqueuosine reductase QueH [Spirochaetota bacterium]HPR47939.1 epoxyqueuosine reductase QueH [Spirochaetota bacterium]